MKKFIIKVLVKIINILHMTGGRDVDKEVISFKGKQSDSYNESPKTTAVVQFFNKFDNIDILWGALLKSGAEEIIIQEDGSRDGSLSKLSQLAVGKNHFIIRSNDLFEVRTYDRSIDFARGKYIALLQDDDIPPPSPDWIAAAESLFETFDELAIIGGRSGLSLMPATQAAQGQAEYKVTGNVAEIPGLFRYKIHSSPQASYNGMHFEFAEVVNRAPMFVRKDAIRELGGIDQSFAPFQCDDVDLCLRAWLAGYKVGLYESGFAYNVGVGGMRLYNKTAPNVSENWRKIYWRYGELIAKGEFRDRVAEANRKLEAIL